MRKQQQEAKGLQINRIGEGGADRGGGGGGGGRGGGLVF
jgi:hypothetical protein